MDKATKIRLLKAIEVAKPKQYERILDLGCGFHAPLFKLLKTDRYIGIDIAVAPSSFLISHNLENGLPPQILQREFDIVFMNEIIEHIENFKSLLIQIKQVLSSNGRVIITTPNCFRLLYGDFFNGIGENRYHIHCFKKSNMRNLARETGYKITKITGTYIRIPPLLHRYVILPSTSTLFSETLVYRLEINGKKG